MITARWNTRSIGTIGLAVKDVYVRTALRSEQNNHRKHLFEEKAKQLKQIVSDYVDSQVAYFTYEPKDSEK